MQHNYTPKQIARFWSKVDKSGGPDACWLWTASCQKDGYGIFRQTLAHRVAWELAQGHIPDGLYVLHHCDNPPCCNPAHLFLGDQFANMADMIAKGRLYDRHGEKNPRAKLTDEQVAEIRALYIPVYGCQTALAKMFGVTPRRIGQIVGGKS